MIDTAVNGFDLWELTSSTWYLFWELTSSLSYLLLPFFQVDNTNQKSVLGTSFGFNLCGVAIYFLFTKNKKKNYKNTKVYGWIASNSH